MEIKTEVRQFLIEKFFAGVPDSCLDDSTFLITSGLINSIDVIDMINFIENRFGIEFLPREIDARNLDTLGQIEELVRKKLGSQGVGSDLDGERKLP